LRIKREKARKTSISNQQQINNEWYIFNQLIRCLKFSCMALATQSALNSKAQW